MGTKHFKSKVKGSARSKKSPRKRRRFKQSHILTFIQKVYGPIHQDIPLGSQPDLPYIKDEGKRKLWKKWYSIWRTKPFKRFVCRMPFFANIVYGVDKTKTVESLSKHILWYEELVRSKGPVYAVKTLKRVRDACVRYAADQTFESLNELALSEDGLPLRVGHLSDWLRSSNVDHRRAAIQVLDIIKLCEIRGDEPSTESIVKTAVGSKEVTNSFIGETILQMGKPSLEHSQTNKIIRCFRSELERMFPARMQQQRLKELASQSDIHMSVRKGPNGPALGTIMKDFIGVTKSGLIEPIKKIAEITHNNELLIILNESSLEADALFGDCLAELSCIDSRLAIKWEAWGKTRYFAICDWYSQSALKGLHKWIFNWLEKQIEDGTMSQDRVAEVVKNWTSVNSPESRQGHPRVYSLDLSKATDRLPATLQREIIQQMFGKTFADNWYTICTNRSFSTPGGDQVKFAVGQPLGVYSSWAMLALTHHLICRVALRLSDDQRDPKSPRYVVIGDDVAMVGDRFADCYSLIMNRILQVDISPIKGFTPETSLGVNRLNNETETCSAEIAKRIFVNGQEISVITPEALKSAWEYPSDYPSVLRQLTNRGCIKAPNEEVPPIALAALNYHPDVATIFATFPLRPGVSKETLKAVCENYQGLLNFVPWYQTDVPISELELETMFRWSIRSSLQSTLARFKDQFNIYIEISRKSLECDGRVYHSKVQEYITRTLLCKAMLYIIELVVETNALNFQGPGQKLDEIASALNTMLDFEAALLGKPNTQRENLHRMRSRVITKLQPLVLHAIRKAKEYFGILLLDAGEQIDFVPSELVDIGSHNLETRSLLHSVENRISHDVTYIRNVELAKRRTMEVAGE